MWYFYFILALFFIFLSQLSGLPQAMFYHLHWAVALPMAFMGFLILVPGLLREVIMFLIWPIFRPVIQLLIEAVGVVNAEDDATYKSEVHPTFVETIVRVCRPSVLPLTACLTVPRIETPARLPSRHPVIRRVTRAKTRRSFQRPARNSGSATGASDRPRRWSRGQIRN